MTDDRGRESARDEPMHGYRREPFERGEGRVMVSLGPLHGKRYCTYSCPFCYVQAGYESFAALSVDKIVSWVRNQDRATFDTIYVSGDTDSFAPPRLSTGVLLLERLAELEKDLLFTTRALLDLPALERVERVAARLRSRGHWLFGCVSIAQLSVPHLEPRPIPPPIARARQLVAFRDRGLVSVLALRPFLPTVPLADYAGILDLCDHAIDIALGEDWYADTGGVLERLVFGYEPPPAPAALTISVMSFDSSPARWRIYRLRKHEAFVGNECRLRGIPFFMRSRPAIEYWRGSSDRN